MTKIENIKTTFPDTFGIIDNLKKNNIRNSQFLKLALKSYNIISQMKDQKLSVMDTLKTNENVNIYDHQVLAALKVKNELGGNVILADEVGLGKTIEAGIIIKEFIVTGLATKVLILAPPSLLPQWQDEMASKFGLDFVNQQGDPRFAGSQNHDLLVMSHSSAVFPKHMDALMNTYWDLVIVDEAHSMKNSDTHKHKFVKNLPKRYLLLLTATPLQNNLEELYNLIDLLHPGYLGTWSQFKEKYMLENNARMFNPIFKDELQKTLSNLIIRTRRKEVQKYISFKNRIPHTKILTPTDNENTLYDGITDIVRNLYFDSDNTLALMTYQKLASSSTSASRRALYKMKMANLITEERYQDLVKIADGIKIDTKLSHLLDLIGDDSSKFLIFTEFYATQDYIADALRRNGYSVTLFNGRMSADEKIDSKQRFKQDVQIMVSTSDICRAPAGALQIS